METAEARIANAHEGLSWVQFSGGSGGRKYPRKLIQRLAQTKSSHTQKSKCLWVCGPKSTCALGKAGGRIGA